MDDEESRLTVLLRWVVVLAFAAATAAVFLGLLVGGFAIGIVAGAWLVEHVVTPWIGEHPVVTTLVRLVTIVVCTWGTYEFGEWLYSGPPRDEIHQYMLHHARRK